MIQPATKYAEVRPVQTGGTTVRPTGGLKGEVFRDWLWRQMRTDGYFARYIAREKHLMTQAIRRVARANQHRRQNNQSDLRLVASVPSRLYHRLKQTDEHFFSDNVNLKNLRRDNPDVVVKL